MLLCLGDIVGYGPDPKLCLDSVRDNATHLISGQHDRAVGGTDHKLRITKKNNPKSKIQNPKSDESTWPHTRSMLSAEDRAYLASLPPELTVEIAGTGSPALRLHLTRLPPDDIESETSMLITMPQARLRELFGKIEANIILVGGPHLPAMRQIDDRLIICPGSLGQPRYGVPDPTFAAWQDGRVQIHHLHYHPETTARKLSLLPLNPEYVLHLQSILQTGGLD